MTRSLCRTLQNVIQTQKCVLCCEYAKPNRCVSKCFAKVSKPNEEEHQQTKHSNFWGQPSQKISNLRWLGTTMSPWAADLKADRPGTKEVLVSKISRGKMQALEHNHTQFVSNALWVWKPMQIHQGRCNVIKRFKPKIKRAAEFNTDCSCWTRDHGKRTRTLLQ